MEGRKSVYCDVQVPCLYSLRPNDTKKCGYHQTHEFAKELVTTIQARRLLGENAFEEDGLEVGPPQWAIDEADAIIRKEENR